MPASTDTQKGTAMDYLSAPRDSGIVKSLMALIGFSVSDGKRLPAGVKIDTLVALNELLAVKSNEEFSSMLATRVHELQASRRTATLKVKATPESIIDAVKSGKINLAELTEALSHLEA
tara:strand:- start:161 stop:517 length:357 start_codon:yes stop_codon:yes gene_type:complete